jgi:hypothetical protein
MRHAIGAGLRSCKAKLSCYARNAMRPRDRGGYGSSGG